VLNFTIDIKNSMIKSNEHFLEIKLDYVEVVPRNYKPACKASYIRTVLPLGTWNYKEQSETLYFKPSLQDASIY
jgi:hypothetical protein